MINPTSGGHYSRLANYTVVGIGDMNTTHLPVVFSEMNMSNETTTRLPVVEDPDEHINLQDEIAVMEFVVVGLVQTILSLIGFVLNTVSSVVWWKEGERNVTIYLLRVLSIVDNSFLIFVLLYHSMPSIYVYCHVLDDHFKTLMLAVPYTWPLLWTTKTMAVWCIVVMSIVRYNIVCSPLKTSVRFSTKRVTQYLAALFLVLILVNIPRWFEIYILKQINPYTNQTEGIPALTPLAKNMNYQIAYMFVFTIIITYILPMSILLYCSIRLIRILREADTYRKTLVVNSVQISHSVTKMLLTVIVLFIICETPEFAYSVLYFITIVDPNGPVTQALKNSHHHISILKAVSDLAFTVNSSCNFFIYYLMARKFRKLVKEIIFCKKQNRKRAFSTSMSTTQRTVSTSCNSSIGNESIVAESPMPPRQSLAEQEAKLDTDVTDRDDELQYRGQNQLALPQAREGLAPNSFGEGNGDVRKNNAIENETEMGMLVNINGIKVEVEMNTMNAN
jgi:hypothetical protein